MEIKIVVEAKRGCGYRKPAKDGIGIYLTGSGIMEGCERLPFPLGDCCPCCGNKTGFVRGYRWINPLFLFNKDKEPKCDPTIPDHHHFACTICTPQDDKAPDYCAVAASSNLDSNEWIYDRS